MTRVQLSPAERALRDITEADLQARVVRDAYSLGWGVTMSSDRQMVEEAAHYSAPAPPMDGLIFHPRYSMGSDPGWPDLTLIRRRDKRLVFAELKRETGKLTPRQERVLDLLRCLEFNRYSVGPAVGFTALAIPQVQVFVWRPSDYQAILEVLR